MVIATKKPKSLVIYKDSVYELDIKGEILQQVMNFKYLGIVISIESYLYKKVKS